MSDAENVIPPSKKRAAGRELSRDNPGLDDEEVSEQEIGTFKRASNDVLATRRMVKVRRQQPTSSAPSSNPFAAIQLVPPTETTATPATEEKNDSGKQEDENEKQSETKTDVAEEAKSATDAGKDAINDKIITAGLEGGDEKVVGVEISENEEEKGNNNESKDPNAETSNLSSFQQLSSSQNAFTGLAGSGASNSAFSFGSTIPNDGVSLGLGSHSSNNEKPPSYPSFGIGLSKNGNSSLFGTTVVSLVSKGGDGVPSMKEVPVETGEENEETVFQADSVLFEFMDGGWKERGKGEIKVNVPKSGTERGRLIMRARGNYRLILNASLYSDMKFTNMEKKGITFACLNSGTEGPGGLSTFALKFKDGSMVEEFRGAVTAHKGEVAAVSSTPENSPKAPEV